MIELMVTVAIILILVTIVLFAVEHISRTAKISATSVDLQNLQSMLADLDTSGGTISFPQTPGLYSRICNASRPYFSPRLGHDFHARTRGRERNDVHKRKRIDWH